jgi:hypothetical protein
MKLDVPPPIATPAEAQWVEGELVRSLMRTARNTQLVGLLLILIVIGVLWGDAIPAALLAWALAALTVAGARFALIRKYVPSRDAAGTSPFHGATACLACQPRLGPLHGAVFRPFVAGRHHLLAVLAGWQCSRSTAQPPVRCARRIR